MSGNSTTLYRFRIELSDIDRAVYETLDFRVAQHPSESADYLITRALAFALNWQEGLEFSAKGLGDPDGPALFVNHANGRMSLWIEIGNPSARKLHKASKATQVLKVYTYKNPELILAEAKNESVHRAADIQVFAFAPEFLKDLASDLPKDIRMSLLINEKILTASLGGRSVQTEMRELRLS